MRVIYYNWYVGDRSCDSSMAHHLASTSSLSLFLSHVSIFFSLSDEIRKRKRRKKTKKNWIITARRAFSIINWRTQRGAASASITSISSHFPVVIIMPAEKTSRDSLDTNQKTKKNQKNHNSRHLFQQQFRKKDEKFAKKMAKIWGLYVAGTRLAVDWGCFYFGKFLGIFGFIFCCCGFSAGKAGRLCGVGGSWVTPPSAPGRARWDAGTPRNKLSEGIL